MPSFAEVVGAHAAAERAAREAETGPPVAAETAECAAPNGEGAGHEPEMTTDSATEMAGPDEQESSCSAPSEGESLGPTTEMARVEPAPLEPSEDQVRF